MKVYPSKVDASFMLHLPQSIEDLKKICKEHGPLDDVRLILNGGAYSRKEITYSEEKKRWHVTHCIDDSTKTYTDASLLKDTNIAKGLANNALLVVLPAETKCGCK